MIRPDRKPGSEDRAPLTVRRLTQRDVSLPDERQERGAAAPEALTPDRRPAKEGARSSDNDRAFSSKPQRGKGKPSAKDHAKPKGSRPLTERRIRNIAEHYVASRECCAQMLRDVLKRRNKRASMAGSHAANEGVGEGQERDDARVMGWIEAEIARLVSLDLINDARYAEMKARAGLSSGKGLRSITMDLTRRGVEAQIVERAVIEASREMTGAWAADPEAEDAGELRRDAETQAIETCMRKKRIGPYRGVPLPQDWKEARKIWAREAAALARRGFSVDLIRSALERAPDEE